MSGGEGSVQTAIMRARNSQRNTYIIREQLTRFLFHQLIDCIKQIPCRVRIVFDRITILGEAVSVFPDLFACGVDVDTLMFRQCTIQNFSGFAQSLSRCSSLSCLHFSKCSLTDEDLDAIVLCFPTLTHLSVFGITETTTSPAGFASVCRGLCACKELTTFQWSDNALGDPGPFVDLVMSVSSLRFIDFSGNAMSGEWVNAITELLNANWQIAELKMGTMDSSLLILAERNKARYRAMTSGLNSRMALYAQPVSDDLFD